MSFFTSPGDITEIVKSVSELARQPLFVGLPLYWTSCRQRGFTVSDLSDVMSANTAKHAGLSKLVGNNAPRLVGDFVIWNPDEKFTVSFTSSFLINQCSYQMF